MILICQKVIRGHHPPDRVRWFRGVSESSSFLPGEVSDGLSQLHTLVFGKPLGGERARGVNQRHTAASE